MNHHNHYLQTDVHRRQFIKWVSLSGLPVALPWLSLSCAKKIYEGVERLEIKNVYDLEEAS